MKITVFTSTYNRAYIIENLYRSLQRQTFRDFEWLIIDDGSTDDTSKLFELWSKDNNDFEIHYYKVKNGGKCKAINYGLELANGMLFFNVDSDDYLTNDALERVVRWEKSLPVNGKYCCIVGNLGINSVETPNSLWHNEYRDANLLERYPEYTKNPIDGEHAYIFYTNIHKCYKYPIFEGEKFLTEAVVWNRMANDGYKARFYNDIICIYEYQADGLTALSRSTFIDNPKGHALWLREKANFIGYSLYERLKLYYSFYCDHAHHLSCKQISEYIDAPIYVIMLIRFLKYFKREKRK